MIVLLGASLTASMTSFDYRPRSRRLKSARNSADWCACSRISPPRNARASACTAKRLRDREPFLSDDLVQRYLADLHLAGMIQRNDGGEWMLTRDLSSVSLYDIYAACDYRLPLGDALPVTRGFTLRCGSYATARHRRRRCEKNSRHAAGGNFFGAARSKDIPDKETTP